MYRHIIKKTTIALGTLLVSATLVGAARGVSHLLHLVFLPGLYRSLCQRCFVNLAMESPPSEAA